MGKVFADIECPRNFSVPVSLFEKFFHQLPADVVTGFHNGESCFFRTSNLALIQRKISSSDLFLFVSILPCLVPILSYLESYALFLRFARGFRTRRGFSRQSS